MANLTARDTPTHRILTHRDVIEARIPRHLYRHLRRRLTDEQIFSQSEEKELVHASTRRPLVYISRESRIPLRGHIAFGVIDRGTNVLQVRGSTGCHLRCPYCSVDEGQRSRTRATDYIVEPDYLTQEVARLAKFKGPGVECHIDGQSEPLLYPYLTELCAGLRATPEVETISAQTAGMAITPALLESLAGHMTRLDVSLCALDPKTATRLAGRPYDPPRVMEMCRRALQLGIDIHLAPLWVPGHNDHEIPRIIRFALDIGAGRTAPPLGIQKYIPYRMGRKMPAKVQSFEEFHKALRRWEEEYGVKLVLGPEDYHIEKRPTEPKPIRRGEKLEVEIAAPGRLKGEMLGVARGRAIATMTRKKVGERVKAEVVWNKHDLYVAREIGLRRGEKQVIEEDAK